MHRFPKSNAAASHRAWLQPLLDSNPTPRPVSPLALLTTQFALRYKMDAPFVVHGCTKVSHTTLRVARAKLHSQAWQSVVRSLSLSRRTATD
eukprot:5257370-Amphidinium_carterae.1